MKPMDRAVQLARAFRPHPNPRVGAVIVDDDGRILGEGAHERPGLAHAEPLAIASAGPSARGATMYVTLEPCHHRGRTGPCTAAIIDAGLRKVVVGASDPDPKVSGRGIEALRSAGIEVTIDPSARGLDDLDPGYFHHRRTGRPRFTLKSALTLDGQVAARDGSSKWITGEEARLDGHRLRADADAVLVGAGTVFADDPRLDVRVPGYEGQQPRPVVIAGARPLPPDAQVLGRGALVFDTGAGSQPGEVVSVPPGEGGGVDLAASARVMGDLGFVDVLIEGGPTLAGNMWAAGLVDRGVWYFGARLAGGVGRPALAGVFETLEQAASVRIVDVRSLGSDLRVEFVLED